ncbi:MAG: beta-lactamase family protein [Planctomycetes bacterium]|nr:beta-lactamase family protein [Planctomycetota bacterium]
MSAVPIGKPESMGLDPIALRRADDLVQRWLKEDRIPAAGWCVGRRGRMIEPRLVGRQRAAKNAPALRKEALFLVASITKPVTVTAVMMLLERGQLALDNRVADFIPAFAGNGKRDVTIRHLMTHTSGLPDMVPNNEKLRRAHQPLSAFVRDTCRLPLLFPSGTRVSYQSMGTLMLAEIVHQVTGVTLADFLAKEVFGPLGMSDTSLGVQAGPRRDRVAGVRVPADLEKADWNWNTPYWLGLGAPWGGLITSPADFARFCQMMLGGGAVGKVRILSPASVRAMTSNQLAAMPRAPEEDRRCRPWGLGWRLNWPAHSANFGDVLGPRTYGHWGATGTLCWMDPDAEAFFILFTTQPQEPEGRFLARLSNVVASSLI